MTNTLIMERPIKLISICVTAMALAMLGCQSPRPSSSSSGLPKRAVEFIQQYDLADDVASVSFGEPQWSLYNMGFERPAVGWTVLTKDSVQIVFSKKGEWLFTALYYTMDDLNPKYFSHINRVNYMIFQLCDDARVVGVSKVDDLWIVAHYETHKVYMGPPIYSYFKTDGTFVKAHITI